MSQAELGVLLPKKAPRLGLGCMRLSAVDGPDEERAIATIHAALDDGLRLLDTADIYAPSANQTGHNERLIGKALDSWSGDREQVVVASKGGLVRKGARFVPDGRARHLKAACQASLEALGVGSIGLYQLHAPDPKTPLATSLRALAKLHREGLVERIGLCNVRVQDIELAETIVDLASVQVALSPHDLNSVKNGVVEYCIRRGIPLIAHSPFGGHRNHQRVPRHDVLRAVAERRGCTAYELTLAWLRGFGPNIVPIPGPTRPENVASCASSLELGFSEQDIQDLDAAFPAARATRAPREARAPSPQRGRAGGEVVLFVGYPGAGKSTAAEAWSERGYVRLNRDREGGTLSGLLPELEAKLKQGERHVVLDNTYPTRSSRFDVIETAWSCDAPVRCVWLNTSLEDAQVNAVERMVARYGRLLTPEEMRTKGREDPQAFNPEAQFRYRRQLEEPRVDEGFVDVDVVPFVREPRSESTRRHSGAKAILFEVEGVIRRTKSGAAYPSDPEDIEILPDRPEILGRYARDGYRLIAISYQPGIGTGEISVEQAASCFATTWQRLGVEVDALYCPHESGPPVCWCRKPLPGLGVVAVRKHGLDPARSILVGDAAADRGLAERLGFIHRDIESFFSGTMES